MNRPLLVGIDIGGTTIKHAFITLEGEIFLKWEIKTRIEGNGEHIVEDILASIAEKMIEETIDKSQLLACGVGAPGFIDIDNGFIYEAVNLGWKDYPLREKLFQGLNIPVVVDNDANLAAGGEKWKGAGEGYNDLIAITLGTGVGGGIIISDEIVHGHLGMAGEIGHIAVQKKDGFLCNCGKRGCLETVASATGIARIGLEYIQKTKHAKSYLKECMTQNGALSAKDIFDGAKFGDEDSIAVLKESMDHLGFTLANLANSLNPEIFVVGGGVSKAGKIVIDELQLAFNLYAIPKLAKETKICLAELGNDAGVIGAAWLAKKKC